MEWNNFSPEVERGLFAGAGPQGSTEGFAAVEDGWAGAHGSTFLDRDWVADPAGAAHGSTEAAGLAPAKKKKANSNTSQYRFTLESFPRRSNSFMSHYCLLMLNTKRWSNSILGTPIKSQNLRYTCRRNKQTKFCGRQMNKLRSHLKLNFKGPVVPTRKQNMLLLQNLPSQQRISDLQRPTT